MKFKVLHGKHSEKDAKGINHTFKQGEIVDSKIDLAARFNSTGAIKFERVDEAIKATTGTVAPSLNAPAVQQQPAAPKSAPPKDVREYHTQIDRMNLKQLQDHAAEEEIDLKGETDVSKIKKLLKDI